MSPAFLGFLRGLGVVVLASVLAYVGNATNLTNAGVTATVATLIAAIVSAVEQSMAAKTGNAVFGLVKGVK